MTTGVETNYLFVYRYRLLLPLLYICAGLASFTLKHVESLFVFKVKRSYVAVLVETHSDCSDDMHIRIPCELLLVVVWVWLHLELV